MEKKRYNWDNLLSADRERKSNGTLLNSNDRRSEFEKDYNRTICSSAVRRLQNKTQVFPLQENDVVRTRLTHSIEVSSIARSMGYAIGKMIINDERVKTKAQDDRAKEGIENDMANILAVAGLIHDLGNPPFGHYGENIIRKWFKNLFVKDGVRKNYSREVNDFLFFEGNAQSLRIVSKLQNLNDEYGLNLTYATLGSIVKYPRTSNELSDNRTKFGFFLSEDMLMDRIFEKTGTGKHERKNPLAYILEAADDITYLLDDIEDGVRKGVIIWEKEKVALIDKLEKINSDMVIYFKNKEEKLDGYQMSDREKAIVSVQNFRVLVQSDMILSANKVFIEKYDDIMNNEFCGDLLTNSKYKSYILDLKEITRLNCFNAKEVLKLELAGDSILNGLLGLFWNAIENGICEDSKVKEGKLCSLISSNFLRVYKSCPNSPYYRRLLLTDYISGMTDSYALKLFRELTGYKLP